MADLPPYLPADHAVDATADAIAVTYVAGLRYRLIEIDLSGQEKVFAEATVTPAMTAQVSRNADSLTVTFCGQPGMGVAVETASAVEGPWNPLNAVELDSDGAGSVTLDVRVGESARFYRW